MGSLTESGLGGRDPLLSPADVTPSLALLEREVLQTKPEGAKHAVGVWVRPQPGERFGGFISLMVNLEKKKKFLFQFEPVKQTRAKASQSLVLAHRPPRPEPACFPAGRAGRGARLLPSSRQPPAGPAAALWGGEAVRDGIPTSSLRGRAGTRVGPRLSTPRPPSAAQPLPRPVLPR